MDSNINKEEVVKFLNSLDEEIVFNLFKTVTQGLLKKKIDNKSDAIDNILKYSTDSLSILRRRILTRDVLFTYLDNENVQLNLPVTKDQLIDKIINHWRKNKELQNNDEQNKILEKDYHDHDQRIQNVYNIYVSDSQLVSSQHTDELARQFCEWFYSNFNSSEGVGVEHFYDDAILNLSCTINEVNNIEKVENCPEEIVSQLHSVKFKYNLYLNPNLTETGVRGKMDTHGFVIAAVCGTLHETNNCVGFFHQIFGLVKDPMADNNWKIKRTDLSLYNKSNITCLPHLSDIENDKALYICNDLK